MPKETEWVCYQCDTSGEVDDFLASKRLTRREADVRYVPGSGVDEKTFYVFLRVDHELGDPTDEDEENEDDDDDDDEDDGDRNADLTADDEDD